MAKVQVTKTWSVSPNIRLTPFVSLNATMGWWLYENKARLLACGWTLMGTSDGAGASFGGPDLWSSASVGPLMRGLTAASPQSWAVLENADGLQLLFTYQGAGVAPVGDDICRISMSQAGLFILGGGGATHQPTATDEVIITHETSVINATASADRVMSLGCTDKDWWNATYRAGSIVLYLSCNEVDSACDLVTLAVPYAVSKLNNMTADGSGPGSNVTQRTSIGGYGSGDPAQSATAFLGVATRVVTSGVPRIIRVGGGARTVPTATAFYVGAVGPASNINSQSTLGHTLSTPPALNNGTIPVLTIDWFGEYAAGMDGYLGSPIDWWYGHTSLYYLPNLGDMIAALAPGDTQATPLRSNWLVALGAGVIRPWLNAAATLQVT